MRASAAKVKAEVALETAIEVAVDVGLQLEDLLFMVGEKLGITLEQGEEASNSQASSDEDDEDDTATSQGAAVDVTPGPSTVPLSSRRVKPSSLVRDPSTSRARTAACDSICGGDFMGLTSWG